MTLRPIPSIGTLLGAAALAAVAALPGRAQEPGEWNDARARQLIDRAIDRRSTTDDGSGLESFTARAEGHIYFYLDRTDTDERTLAKADQVAIELYWRAPNLTKQRIVGRRDVDRLPNRMYYHIDHLTVVLDEFGDVIRMGEGDEVRAVPHPAAPGAPARYDYRFADSLTLRFPEGRDPLHLLRVEVRPKEFDRPGIIGSLFIDRASAEIVRMSFTFTPASYVDPRLDYIRVSLDNGLWDGRHWLPNEQRVEIRRQVPQLDFPAGGVIRGVFRIGDYRLDPPLEEALFRGPRIIALPESQRERHRFETDIYAGLEDATLESEEEPLAAVREQAKAIVRDRYLSGLPRLRLYLPGASSGLRYNRAEGLFLGIGGTYAVGNSTSLDLAIGRAFAADHWPITAELAHRRRDATSIALRLERGALRDLGPIAGAAGAINTIHAAFAAEDYLDPYFAAAAALRIEHRLARGWLGRVRLGVERHRSASLAVHSAALNDGATFDRPVRRIDDGTLAYTRLTVRRRMAPVRDRDWAARLAVEAGRLDDGTYLRPVVDASAAVHSTDDRVDARVDGAIGAGLGSLPAQRLFLLGGRGTLPGHAYRGFVGDRFALIRLSASHRLIGPWVRLRVLAAGGWTDLVGDSAPPAGWDVDRSSGGLRASAGLGLGLIHDVLRVDAMRGLDGGRWVLIISAAPELHDLL